MDTRHPVPDFYRMILERIIPYISVKNLGSLLNSSWTVMKMVIELHPKLLIAVFTPNVKSGLIGKSIHESIRQSFGDNIQLKSTYRPRRCIKLNSDSVDAWDDFLKLCDKEDLENAIEKKFSYINGSKVRIHEERAACGCCGGTGKLIASYWISGSDGDYLKTIPLDNVILRVRYAKSWILTIAQVNGTINKQCLTGLMRQVSDYPRKYYKDLMTEKVLLRPEGMKARSNQPTYVCLIPQILLQSFGK